MPTLGANKGEARQYVLVRDSLGKPKLDNPRVFQEVLGLLDLMTDTEKEEIRNGNYS